MRFMVTWRVHEDKRHETLRYFAAMSKDEIAGEFGSLKVTGRWHDVIGLTGVAIVEAKDHKALAAWLIKWNDGIDIEATPVMDDKEARAFARKELG